MVGIFNFQDLKLEPLLHGEKGVKNVVVDLGYTLLSFPVLTRAAK